MKPIIVPDERADGYVSEVELQLVISRSKVSTGNPWETFHVYSHSDDGSWSEHCNGLIRAYRDPDQASPDEVEGTRENDLSSIAALANLSRITQSSQDPVNPDTFYSSLRASGNDYGPSFSSISEIGTGKLDGFAKVIIPDIPSFMPSAFLQPHVIHPSTLDTLGHVVCMLYKQQCKNSPIMLEFIEEVVVSSAISSEPGTELVVAAQLEPRV